MGRIWGPGGWVGPGSRLENRTYLRWFRFLLYVLRGLSPGQVPATSRTRATSADTEWSPCGSHRGHATCAMRGWTRPPGTLLSQATAAST
jgi:hypothetical protein